jgi:hypothetical protein
MKGVTEVPFGLGSGRFLKKAAQKLLYAGPQAVKPARAQTDKKLLFVNKK